MTPLVVENEPPVTFLRRKMTGGRFSMGVVIRRYTGRSKDITFVLSLFCREMLTLFYRISVFFRILMQGSITVAALFIRNNAR